MFFILRRLSFDVSGVSNATEATENMLLPEKQTDFLTVLLSSTETSTIALDQFLDLGMFLWVFINLFSHQFVCIGNRKQ